MNKSTHTRQIEHIADLMSECDEALEHIESPATQRLIRRKLGAKAGKQAPKETTDA